MTGHILVDDQATLDFRAGVLADPRFEEQHPALRHFMAESRTFRDQPDELLGLQAEMAGALISMQQATREIEAEINKDTTPNSPHLRDAEKALGVSKLVARIIRCVADGIAWRTLRYDRAAIYLLSLKPQTGHLEHASVTQELTAAALSKGTSGRLAIINDLTNFLRYGDFTILDGDVVEIAEVKGGRGSRRSGRARRQVRALTTVLDRLSTEEWKTEGGTERIFRHNVKPRSHLYEVRDLVRQAREKGATHRRLSDCIAVDLWYIPTLTQVAEPEDAPKLLHNPFSQSKQASWYNRMEFFHEFSRNLAPYSIYPFGDDDCVDLMTGALQLTTYFNYGNLIRCLRRRGLLVRFPHDSEFRAHNELSHGEKSRRVDDVAIRVARPGRPHQLLIELPLLARLIYELLDEESFADAVEELVEESAADTEPTIYFPAFQEEAALWD